MTEAACLYLSYLNEEVRKSECWNGRESPVWAVLCAEEGRNHPSGLRIAGIGWEPSACFGKEQTQAGGSDCLPEMKEWEME